MMPPKIKLCGINSRASAETAEQLHADYVGMVFYPPSPRHVTPQQAAGLLTSIPVIAVTVNADDALLEDIIRAVNPLGLQLHGNESPERLNEIRARWPELLLIKAIPVRTQEDVRSATAYESTADWLLFDAKPPTNSLPGGTGQAFDWQLLKGLHLNTPWFLSGGLNEANVADAIRITGAQAVDVSSGIESAPGVKDVEKMRAFVAAVHGAAA